MTKASIVGAVKTRLVPPLTREEAAELNTCCIADSAANIAAVAERVPIQGFAAYHPPGSEAFFEALLPRGFKLLPPKEPTIGRSLFHAARDLLGKGYQSVCLVNADSPTLPVEALSEAVDLLRQPGDRLVLGPAADGGYYLIGLKRFHPRLFERIDWSTERVYRQTVERAGDIELPVVALPEWYDVDDEASLAVLVRELLCGAAARRGSLAPKTAVFLKQLAGSNAAVRRLMQHRGGPAIARNCPRES